MRVADCMTRTPIVIGPTESLASAMELMGRHRIRHLPVVDGGANLIGMVTDRDARRAAPSIFLRDAAQTEEVLQSIPVEKVMVRSPATATPGQPLKELLKVMVEKKYGAMPVIDGGRLVGIVSMIDVLRVSLPLLP